MKSESRENMWYLPVLTFPLVTIPAYMLVLNLLGEGLGQGMGPGGPDFGGALIVVIFLGLHLVLFQVIGLIHLSRVKEKRPVHYFYAFSPAINIITTIVAAVVFL